MGGTFIFRIFIFTLGFLIVCLSGPAFAENLAIIVSSQSSLLTSNISLKIEDIKSIYLGKIISLRGIKVKPVNQKDRNILKQFLEKVCRMSIAEYQHHWVKHEIEMGLNSPGILGTSNDVIVYCKNGRDTIGYVWESETKDAEGIKTLLVLSE